MDTTSAAFFEEKYRDRADPWNFATSAYETSRYEAILGSLGRERFQRAFEPACSIGVLTEKLAPLCGELQALDAAATAVEQARQRCAGLPQVTVTCGTMPEAMPGGVFDLIVFSELGYYFSEEALAQLGAVLVQRLLPGGTLVAAHWLGSSPDHLLSGDTVHALLETLPGLTLEKSERYEGFRLQRWVRA